MRHVNHPDTIIPSLISVIPRVRLFYVLMTCFCTIFATGVYAKPSHSVMYSKNLSAITHVDKKALIRMANRRRLLAESQRRLVSISHLTPGQKRLDEVKQRQQREENREMLPHWTPDALNRHWQRSQRNADTEDSLVSFIDKLKQQLGKPYVWGGTSPQTGFDCSGLVWYAYTGIINQQMPRTANGMYTDRNYQKIARNELSRGDLIFFGVHHKTTADHVGVYLGDGKFIEAPRTGLNVRVSYLADTFWQIHYLGARRVIYDRHPSPLSGAGW
ncbi:C40 family peptidase [Enterobacter ludwigii]|uniref:C40 family peptidase n=1 Tax=Enterobacter ludwigii TaxID=299767 RepID=UPI003F6EE153